MLSRRGIRVNAVAPGPIWNAASIMPEDQVSSFGKNTPFGRPGQPKELAVIHVLVCRRSRASRFGCGLDIGPLSMFDHSMAEADPTGTDWTPGEIDLIVADYFDMLAMELRGEPFVKAHRNAALRQLVGRSKGSIEFKHQNISAVLLRLGMRWITGYLPRANFQRTLVDGVERFLDARGTAPDIEPGLPVSFVAEAAPIFLEQPPQPELTEPAEPAYLERLVRKFDPAARDARNRALGLRGEERVFFSEQIRLRSQGRDDLARKVQWVSQVEGDGAGYDIRSFDLAGSERLLEVKTTTGHRTTPFYLSENERAMSEERPEAFRLLRLYDFAREPRGFELVPPLASSVILKPANWRASF